MVLTEKIKEIYSLPDGVDLVGIAPVERFAHLPERTRPSAFLPKSQSVIVIASQLFQVLTSRLTAQRRIGEVSFRDFYNAHMETVNADLNQTG